MLVASIILVLLLAKEQDVLLSKFDLLLKSYVTIQITS